MNAKGTFITSTWMLRLAILGLGLLAVVATGAGLGVSILAQRQPTSRTETISFDRWHASEVVARLKAWGLEVKVVQTGKRDGDDGLALFPGAEAIRFRIPSQGENEGGIILAFPSAADLERAQEYYLGLNTSLPMFSSWVFAQDNILLQINRSLPEAKARQYQLALYSLEY